MRPSHKGKKIGSELTYRASYMHIPHVRLFTCVRLMDSLHLPKERLRSKCEVPNLLQRHLHWYLLSVRGLHTQRVTRFRGIRCMASRPILKNPSRVHLPLRRNPKRNGAHSWLPRDWLKPKHSRLKISSLRRPYRQLQAVWIRPPDSLMLVSLRSQRLRGMTPSLPILNPTWQRHSLRIHKF